MSMSMPETGTRREGSPGASGRSSSGRSSSGRSSQVGQVVPLVAVFIVVAALAAMGIVKVAHGAVDRARAQTAADAAALAAAVQLDPIVADRVAESVAGHNDAEIIEMHHDALVVVVTVRVGTARATAAARPVAAGP